MCDHRNGLQKLWSWRSFTSSSRDIGISFQSAITTPRLNLIGCGTATAQSWVSTAGCCFCTQHQHTPLVGFRGKYTNSLFLACKEKCTYNDIMQGKYVVGCCLATKSKWMGGGDNGVSFNLWMQFTLFCVGNVTLNFPYYHLHPFQILRQPRIWSISHLGDGCVAGLVCSCCSNGEVAKHGYHVHLTMSNVQHQLQFSLCKVYVHVFLVL